MISPPFAAAAAYQPGEQRMERRYAFVLRIWLTDSTTSRGQMTSTLRGALQPINSNEALYFHSLRQLHDLLERAIEEDSARSSDAI
jgi:hypothetical protein